MLYEFELCHNIAEATKNICAKGEVTIDNSTISKWLKKFCSGYRNLDDWARSCKFKSIASEAVLKAIEANLASSTWRVSVELKISQSIVIHQHQDLSKSFKNCQTVSLVSKISQNMWPTFVYIKHIVASWSTVVGPFLKATKLRCREGLYSFPWIAPLSLDPYLIMVSAKQGGIEYHFLRLWYDATSEWSLRP